jgi:hypothetical protein
VTRGAQQPGGRLLRGTSRRTSASSRSYVVTIPTSLPSAFTTGKQLILRRPICAAADSIGSSGAIVYGFGVIVSATERSRMTGRVAPMRPTSVVEKMPTRRSFSTTGTWRNPCSFISAYASRTFALGSMTRGSSVMMSATCVARMVMVPPAHWTLPGSPPQRVDGRGVC